MVLDWCVRCLPLAFAVLFIGGLVGYRAVRFVRLYGFSPIHVPRPADWTAHACLSRVLVLCFAAILALAALAAFWPAVLQTVDPSYFHAQPALLMPGLGLAALATWLVWWGQEDMAASWRIGIAPAEQTELVTRGLFRFCRNPIYLGLQVGLAAFCCFLPGCISAALLVLGVILLKVQTRLEEVHLLQQHGASYAAYCARVGRFLPFTGRWPATSAPAERKHDERAD